MQIIAMEIEYEADGWLLTITTTEDVFAVRALKTEFPNLGAAVKHHLERLERE